MFNLKNIILPTAKYHLSAHRFLILVGHRSKTFGISKFIICDHLNLLFLLLCLPATYSPLSEEKSAVIHMNSSTKSSQCFFPTSPFPPQRDSLIPHIMILTRKQNSIKSKGKKKRRAASFLFLSHPPLTT